MEQQIGKYYWGLWAGSTTKSSSSTTRSPIIPAWAAAAASPYISNEPSWEEQAFARDSAAHLGGCVWPPRSYPCSFCQREFRSAQALGGHMNVHRRDRALLRQGSSSPEDGGQEAPPVEQPLQGGPFLLYKQEASNPSAAISGSSILAVPAAAHQGDVILAASIIKESKNKLFMSSSIPASMTMREAAKDQCDHDDVESGRTMKRRRLDPPSVTLPIFVQTTISMLAVENESQAGVDRDANKVPEANPSSVIPSLLDQQEEVDLVLRLGSTPKLTRYDPVVPNSEQQPLRLGPRS